MAASARRGLIDLAISTGRVPAATDCLLPSGRVISMLLIGNFQRSTLASWLPCPLAYARGSVSAVFRSRARKQADTCLRHDHDGNAIAFLAIRRDMQFHAAVVADAGKLHFHQVHADV